MSECWGQGKDEGLGVGRTNRYQTEDLKSGRCWTCPSQHWAAQSYGALRENDFNQFFMEPLLSIK